MDDKDVIIDRLMRKIDSLLDRIQSLEAENLDLKERIARLEKNSSTSSKPPSSDILHPPTSVVKKKKCRRGGQPGHFKHTREPFAAEAIDQTIIHKLPDEEVRRRRLVELPRTALALPQITLPEKLYRVTEHRVQLYKTFDGPSESIPTGGISAANPSSVSNPDLINVPPTSSDKITRFTSDIPITSHSNKTTAFSKNNLRISYLSTKPGATEISVPGKKTGIGAVLVRARKLLKCQRAVFLFRGKNLQFRKEGLGAQGEDRLERRIAHVASPLEVTDQGDQVGGE